jgi:hypothetical protein
MPLCEAFDYRTHIYSFILEGVATVLIAISAFFVLFDFPDTASFLTIEERAWVVHRLKYQGSEGSGHMVAETEGFHINYVKAAFTDWQIYIGLFVSFIRPYSTNSEGLTSFSDVLGNCLSSLWHLIVPPNHH